MSSVVKDKKTGTKRFMFYDATKKRRTIRLGKMTMEAARAFQVRADALISAKAFGGSPDAETARWASELPEKIYNDLAKHQLVPPRKKVGTLKELIPPIIEARAAKVSSQTVEIWRQAERSLYKHFGEDKKVDTITRNDAEAFRTWLETSGRLDGKGGLESSTVWKRLQHVISFFGAMVLNDDLVKSPFIGMSMDPSSIEERNEYVEEELVYKVMKAAPDAEWRLIMALWRFAGLRGSTEPLLLRWKDILWKERKIRAYSWKLRKHKQKRIRFIPLFPELIEPLQQARAEADKDDVYIITKHAPRYLRGVADRFAVKKLKGNMGSIFRKFARNAGVEPWPKIVNNMRASFITDLLEGKHKNDGEAWPIHYVAYWANNSPKVILKYYARIRNKVYDQIAGLSKEIDFDGSSLASVTLPTRSSNREPHTSSEKSNDSDDSEAAQKAAQHTPVTPCTRWHNGFEG